MHGLHTPFAVRPSATPEATELHHCPVCVIARWRASRAPPAAHPSLTTSWLAKFCCFAIAPDRSVAGGARTVDSKKVNAARNC